MEREDYIEMKVKDSMRKGCEHFPFASNNVTEALTQMCFADQSMLASYTKMVNDNPNQFYLHTYLADFIVGRVNAYWKDVAEYAASEQYDKAGF